MKITHYLYNAFLVEEGETRIVIDPGQNTWTMDVDDALQAVELIDPELVIPCHYSVPFLWKKKFAIADDGRFEREVETLGKNCSILGAGDFVAI